MCRVEVSTDYYWVVGPTYFPTLFCTDCLGPTCHRNQSSQKRKKKKQRSTRVTCSARDLLHADWLFTPIFSSSGLVAKCPFASGSGCPASDTNPHGSKCSPQFFIIFLLFFFNWGHPVFSFFSSSKNFKMKWSNLFIVQRWG